MPQSDEELQKIHRYFKLDKGQYGEATSSWACEWGQGFALAKEFIDVPPPEIEKLLESPIHEVRAGAVSIMATMPRTALRYAIEHLDQADRSRYLSAKNSPPKASQA